MTEQYPNSPLFFYPETSNLKLHCLDKKTESYKIQYPERTIMKLFKGFICLNVDRNTDLDLTVYWTTQQTPPPKRLSEKELYISFFDVPKEFAKYTYLTEIEQSWNSFTATLNFHSTQRHILRLKPKFRSTLRGFYIIYTDKQNIVLAIQKGKKIWVTLKLLDYRSDTIQTFINFLHKKQPKFWTLKPFKNREDYNNFLQKNIEVQLKNVLSARIKKLKKEVEQCLYNIKSYENQMQNNLKQLHDKKALYQPYLEQLKNFDYHQTIKDVFNLPFIEKIENIFNGLKVYTKTIFLDEMSFGKFEFLISFDGKQKVFIVTESKKPHPYEYDDSRTMFCYGEFNDALSSALSRYDLKQIILICLNEVTNYSFATMMQEIEPYLNSLNKKKVTTWLKELAKKQNINLDNHVDFCITSIENETIRFTAKQHQKRNGFIIVSTQVTDVEACLKMKY